MHSSPCAPYGATLVRLSLGLMWISHALLKLLVFTLPGFAAFLDAHGLPAVLAGPVVLAELAGGTAILLGLHGRLASLLLLPILATALWTHLPNGWVFTAPNGGWEFPAHLMVWSVAHALLGDGAFALRSAPACAARTA